MATEPAAVPPRPVRRTLEPKPEPAIDLANGKTAFSSEARSPEQVAYVHAVEDLETARRRYMKTAGPLDPAAEEWARRTAWLTAVWAEGLGYRAGAAHGVGLELTRLREMRGELTGELTVTRDGMHLLMQRFNLSNGQGRIGLAKQLAAHPFGGEGRGRVAVDWREVLEQFCLRVLELERAGEDFEHVGTMEPQPTPPRIIDPYLPMGPTLVWAPQGVGKSTLAAAVAVTLESYAEVIPGWHPTTMTHVLVLDWEASPIEWNDRIARISAGVGLEEPPSVLYRRPRRPLAEQIESIAAIRDREGVGFLIIDSVEKAAGSSNQADNYEAKAERLFMAIDRIGLPCLLIDHLSGDDVRHGAGKVAVKSIGSILKGAWARATYDLKRDPDTSTETEVQMLLTNVKVNDARKERPYEFAIHYEGDEHTGPIRFTRSRLDSPELLSALPQPDQMWRYLVREGAHSAKDVAEAIDTTQATIRSILQRDGHRDQPRFMRLPDGRIGVREA
jgi:hypothetical protein